MSSRTDFDGLLLDRPDDAGPACCRTADCGPGRDRAGLAVDGLPAVDDRGWHWTVTADLDMGAWFDPGRSADCGPD